MAVIEQFLTSISGFLHAKDAAKLQDWLRVEPPLPDQYYNLGRELQISYADSDTLERYIAKLIPENDSPFLEEGGAWPGFLAFIKEYLEFWRDVNFEDLLETHSQLSGLVKFVDAPHTRRDAMLIHVLTVLASLLYRTPLTA
jgi:nuclear mRNA export protein PCID2/THP1